MADDYDREQDVRRAMDDYRHDYVDGDTESTIIYVVVGCIVVVGALLAASGWLDSHFHWHLTIWVKQRLGLT